MVKKIALISVWNHNYGSLLQTYALQKLIESLNYESEIILYHENSIFRKLIRFVNSYYFTAKLKIIYRNLLIKLCYRNVDKNIQIRSEKFEEFKRNKLIFSKQIRGRYKLKREINHYQCAVLGSDQVWHPANLLFDYFTLNFVSDNIKKIAYSSSFGVSRIPFYQRIRTSKYLNRFDALSIREVSGQKIVKELISKEIPLVCDPTLLVDKEVWDNLKGKERIIVDSYIFCYFLGNNKLHRNFANRLKKVTGFKIVALQHLDEFVKNDILFGDIKPFDIDPANFINLLCNAEFVLTDSFHATIFSVIYQKHFFTFNRYSHEKSTSTNSRIASILSQFNLLDRNIIGDEEISDYLYKTIDYSGTQQKIEQIKTFSLKYLLDALK